MKPPISIKTEISKTITLRIWHDELEPKDSWTVVSSVGPGPVTYVMPRDRAICHAKLDALANLRLDDLALDEIRFVLVEEGG